MNCGTLWKSALVAVVLMAVIHSGSAVNIKLSSCCSKVSRQVITEPITGYMVQKPSSSCVRAVIFQTETGLFCSQVNAPWVRRKIIAFEKAKARASPSSVVPSSTVSLLTSTSPPSTSSSLPPSSPTSSEAPSSTVSLLSLITSTSPPSTSSSSLPPSSLTSSEVPSSTVSLLSLITSTASHPSTSSPFSSSSLPSSSASLPPSSSSPPSFPSTSETPTYETSSGKADE